MQTNTTFNPQVLLLARNMSGLSQSEMAAPLGMTQAYYSRLENGLAGPSAEQVRKLGEITGHPDCFFFIPGVVTAPLPPHMMFRKTTVARKDADRFHSQIMYQLMHLRQLDHQFAFQKQNFSRLLDFLTGSSSAEDFAKSFRAFHGRLFGPLYNLFDLIESSGILLVPFKNKEVGHSVDGVSLRPVGMLPVIFFNRKRPADRQRFTVAHELGHLLMHAQRPPHDKMEEEANSFASELLMPAMEFLHIFANGVSFPNLPALKRQWQVSIASLIYRANSLGKVTVHQYRMLWQHLTRLGWRTTEPAELDFPAEQPTLLKSILYRYAPAQLCEMFCINPNRLEELYYQT